MPWAQVYRKLASDYGWEPERVNKLTYYQAAVLCGALCYEDGDVFTKKTMTLEQFREWQKQQGGRNQMRQLNKMLGA